MSRTFHFVSKSKKRLTLFGVVIVALAAAIGAVAYWTTQGSGSASASLGTLNPPTDVAASASGATVHVSWTAPASPSVAPTGYYVTRSDGTTTSAACGSSAGSPLTPTDCDDTNVPSGSYTYAVTAVYHSWSATSAASSSVTVAPLDHFLVSAPASAAAGSPFSVTVTAQDASNNTVTTYAGSVHFTSSDSGSPVLPSDYTFVSGDGGSHTFTNGVTLKTTPSQTVAVNDTVETTKTGQATVTVNPAGAATFTVSGFPSSTVAGVSHLFSVTAKDQFGNTDSNYAGTVHFTATGDAQAVLPANSTLTAGSGGFSATFKTVAGGAKTLIATDTVTSSITGSQSGITVTPASASTLVVAGYTTPAVAGVSHSFNVTALDPFGNTDSNYAGTVHFTATGDAAAALPADSTLTAGSGSFSATFKTVAGGTKTLTATDTVTSSIMGSQSGIAVSPAGAASLVVAGFPSSTAGVSGTFSVTAKDAFNNTATGYLGTVHFTSSDAQATLPANYTFLTGNAGTRSFSATLKTAGTQSITATDTVTGSINGSQTVISITAAGTAKLAFITVAQTLTAGVNSGTITVQRQDSFGNATTSGGFLTVALTSSSAGGSFRDSGNTTTITSIQISGGQSTANFLYRDTVAGTPTITGASGSLTSATQVETVNTAAASKLAFTTSPQTTTANISTGTITVQRQDSFGNPTSSGPLTVDLSSNSPSGVFYDTSNTIIVTQLTLANGVSSGSFLYRDTKAGTPTLTATDHAGALTSATQQETINPAAASSLVVAGFSSPQTAGVSGTFTVTAKDAFNNTTTGYRGIVHFTSDDPDSPVLPSNYTFVAGDNGAHTFSATLKTSGIRSITATDTVTGSITGSQTGITVNPAAAASLVVAGFPSPQTAGVFGTFSVTAKDAFGNAATGYRGTAHFTSSDAQASLPANYAFVAADNGTHTFSATLKTAGTQSITATDTVTSSINGNQAGITVNAVAATSKLAVTGFTTPTVAGAVHSFTVTAQDAFGNTTGRVP